MTPQRDGGQPESCERPQGLESCATLNLALPPASPDLRFTSGQGWAEVQEQRAPICSLAVKAESAASVPRVGTALGAGVRRPLLSPRQAAGQGPSQAPARLYGKVVLSRCSHCCGSCEPWSAPEGSLLLPPDPLSPSAESCSGLKPLPPLLVWRLHSGHVRGLLALVTMSPDHVKEADCCHPRPPELETT